MPGEVPQIVCLRCGGQTKKATFYDGTVHLHPNDLGIELFPSIAPCTAFVCLNCGHVEIFVDTLEPFYKKR